MFVAQGTHSRASQTVGGKRYTVASMFERFRRFLVRDNKVFARINFLVTITALYIDKITYTLMPVNNSLLT